MTATRRKRDDDSITLSTICSGNAPNMEGSQCTAFGPDASTIATDATIPRRRRKRQRTNIVDQFQQIQLRPGSARTGVPNQIVPTHRADVDEHSQTLTSSEDDDDDDADEDDASLRATTAMNTSSNGLAQTPSVPFAAAASASASATHPVNHANHVNHVNHANYSNSNINSNTSSTSNTNKRLPLEHNCGLLSDLEKAQQRCMRTLVFGPPAEAPRPINPVDQKLQTLIRQSLHNVKNGKHPIPDQNTNIISQSADDMAIDPPYTRGNPPFPSPPLVQVPGVPPPSAFMMRERSNSMPDDWVQDTPDQMETS
eukprot:Nitzschia sp. Nitz4//scaffold366_size23882//7943//8878//NITZ4_008439-RA/size23882-processed-gene-0.31-mRNA-1//-1//CDS//3329549302//6433//frame0